METIQNKTTKCAKNTNFPPNFFLVKYFLYKAAYLWECNFKFYSRFAYFNFDCCNSKTRGDSPIKMTGGARRTF